MAFMSDIPAGRTVTSALRSLGTAVTDGLVKFGRAQARSDEIEYFMSLSDEELAKRGLTRETAVRHVFRDRMVF
ncbi:MAG: DUF1127 domain-containing protein [Pseudomonadota bacterium]